LSFIELNDSEKDSTEFSYGLNGTETRFGSDMGTVGLSHLYFFKNKLRIKSTLLVSGTQVTTKIDSLNDDKTSFPFLRSKQAETKYSFSTSLAKKMNTRNYLKWGLIFDIYQVNYLDSVWQSDDQKFRTYNDGEGNLYLLQSFLQWQHKFSDQLTLSNGIHYQQLFFNQSISIEPRIGLKWSFTHRQSILK